MFQLCQVGVCSPCLLSGKGHHCDVVLAGGHARLPRTSDEGVVALLGVGDEWFNYLATQLVHMCFRHVYIQPFCGYNVAVASCEVIIS